MSTLKFPLREKCHEESAKTGSEYPWKSRICFAIVLSFTTNDSKMSVTYRFIKNSLQPSKIYSGNCFKHGICISAKIPFKTHTARKITNSSEQKCRLLPDTNRTGRIKPESHTGVSPEKIFLVLLRKREIIQSDKRLVIRECIPGKFFIHQLSTECPSQKKFQSLND